MPNFHQLNVMFSHLSRLAVSLLPIVCITHTACAKPLTCNDSRGFKAWMGDVKTLAKSRHYTDETIRIGLSNVVFDQRIINLDRDRKIFKLDFEDFAKRLITPERVKKGKEKLLQYQKELAQIERKSGVPPSVIVAIWGTESMYGERRGRFPSIQAVATLAYDCRRTKLFQEQLFADLTLIQDGYLKPEEMIGAWAGEIGQAQFLPSSYLRFAVSYDGHSRPNLINNPRDVLASVGNYLKQSGWKRGQAWQEGDPNFRVLKRWNQSTVFIKTIGRLAILLEKP